MLYMQYFQKGGGCCQSNLLIYSDDCKLFWSGIENKALPNAWILSLLLQFYSNHTFFMDTYVHVSDIEMVVVAIYLGNQSVISLTKSKLKTENTIL